MLWLVNSELTAACFYFAKLLGVNLTSSMQAEYTVSDDVIKSVVATENWTVRLNLDEKVSSAITVKLVTTVFELLSTY